MQWRMVHSEIASLHLSSSSQSRLSYKAFGRGRLAGNLLGARQRVELQHSHHEEGAATVSRAGAFGRVFVGLKANGAQQETQDVADHHQEDQAAHGQTDSPPEGGHLSLKHAAPCAFDDTRARGL